MQTININTSFLSICTPSEFKICIGYYKESEGIMQWNAGFDFFLDKKCVITESILPYKELYNEIYRLSNLLIFRLTFNHKKIWNL